MKKKSLPITNIGTSSLIMIFTILFISVFAILSLTTALSSRKYADKYADHTTEFYTASNKATEVLAEIDNIVNDAKASGEDLNTTKIQELNDSIVLEDSEVSYTIDMNENQAIYVKLELDIVSPDNNYNILAWKEITTSEWNETENMHVIQMEGAAWE